MHLSLPNWLMNFGRINISLSDHVTVLLILILSVVIMSYIINMILISSIGGIYRIFIAPGVIVHEMSHALGCMITGAKINSINVFKSDGGEVKHTPSKIPVIGPIIISLAPFAIGAFLIYLLAKFVGINSIQAEVQPTLLQDPIKNIWMMLQTIDFHQIRSWLALYLIVTIAVTMTPSTQDFRNIILSLITLVLLLFVLVKYLGVHIPISLIIRPEMIVVLGSCLAILIVALLFSIVIAVVAGIFRR